MGVNGIGCEGGKLALLVILAGGVHGPLNDKQGPNSKKLVCSHLSHLIPQVSKTNISYRNFGPFFLTYGPLNSTVWILYWQRENCPPKSATCGPSQFGRLTDLNAF